MNSVVFWDRIRNLILDMLFPIRCLGCGREFEDLQPKERWICPECLAKIEIRKEQVCPVCEGPSEGGLTHYHCRAKTSLNGLWVATEYEYKVVAEAIHKLKFNFIRDISFPLSKVIIRSIVEVDEFSDFQDVIMFNSSFERGEEELYSERRNRKAESIIIPVPLHKKRYNWRGFNQAFLLARYVASRFNLRVCDNLLVRERNTKSQTRIRSMDERRKNIKGAFLCQNRDLVRGKNIIVVDDVCTTLATLNECAKELKKAGAKSVWGLVVARR